MSGIKVIKPGVLTTLQDWGRYGQRENGLSSGGPMDEHAFLWVNRLLDNPPKSCMIEITIGLASFVSQINSTIAVCGADMGLTINKKPAACWSTHPIKVGDTLQFSSSSQGLRTYLGIAGGFNVEPVFGSSATVVREHLGGLNGQALQQGDVILAQRKGPLHYQRRVPYQFIPAAEQTTTLRFIPGYQTGQFESSQRYAFSNNVYVVSQRQDRMGCQMLGEKIHYEGAGIISEGIALGSIQIPPDGQPIILLKDSGSIGGYPKLGCITRIDLNKLAQCRPGDQINFQPVDHTSASVELIEFYNFFKLRL